MPAIKLQHIVSCSSEDKNNPADNLLRAEGTHKWKAATVGEKAVSCVIQLEKSSLIHSIDIGNEGSAFVEILVGKATASSDQDYQVLLVASSFMTPLEARNGNNRTSVRMFDTSKLSATVCKEKWDRVKIVCTQPFSKTSTYGLSFIKFHAPPEPGESTEPVKKLGFFKLKDDKEDVKTGSIFQNRGKTSPTPATPVSGAAAVRAASRQAESASPARPSPSSSTPSKPPTTASVTPSTSKASSIGHSSTDKDVKTEKTTPAGNREKRKHNVSDDDESTDDETNDVPNMRKHSTSLSSVSSKDSARGPPPLKKTKSEPPKECAIKEFSKLMEKVVFVLSGYQNPHRAEIRDQAIAMGATYKTDWGKGCTHLICAFVNTPKYNQVEGKGRIVNKKWITDSYKQKKLIPWRKYRMGDAETPDEDSEDEVTQAKSPEKTPKKRTVPKERSPSPPIPAIADSDDDMYGGNTDSGDDTEDEIRRIKEKEKKKKVGVDKGKSPAKPTTVTAPVAVDDDDPYGMDTDEDAVSDADSGLPELPDFLAGKYFLLYGKMEDTERRMMTRYITAYAGELEDYMSDKVKYVVTSAKWDKNFDDALSDNPNLVFVKPRWVRMCHEKQKAMPHQPYVVVPPDE